MREDIKERIRTVNQGRKLDGHKDTLGSAPVDWKEYQLKKIAKKANQKNTGSAVTTVLSNTAAHGVIKQTDYFEKDIANAENIDGYYVVEEKDFVYNPRVSTMAPYGPIHANELGIKGIVSPLYTVFRLMDSDEFEYDYMRHYFDSSQWHKYMYTVANYGARYDRMNISGSDFFALPIALPTIKEQKQIVNILNHCDKVVELKQQLVEEEQNRRKWLMQNLLGNKNTYKKVKIGQIAEVYAGATPSTKIPEYWGGDIRWMSSGELNYKRVYEVEGRITQAGLSNSGTKLLPSNCVLVGLAGQGKTRGTVAINYVPLCTNQSIAAILPSEKFDSEYLFWNLENRYTELRKLSSGDGARGGLNLDIIKGVSVFLPSIHEQKRIAKTLSSSERVIFLLEQELLQWQQKKKALMQLLLTGIVRVSV